MAKIQNFDSHVLVDALSGNNVEYKEFLKESSLHCGIYHLAAGQEDPQQPHSEDEVYYVLGGRARFETEEGTSEVSEGTILFVKAYAQHRFVGITQNLTLLVFFASNGKTAEEPG